VALKRLGREVVFVRVPDAAMDSAPWGARANGWSASDHPRVVCKVNLQPG